jgi:hypothetical protein
VNTSVTTIRLVYNGVEDEDAIDESNLARVGALVARNKRLRSLFLFDARQMMISAMCSDWCGVVWPYLLESDDINDDKIAPDNVEAVRAEFAAVVAERRCRLQVAVPGAKRRRLE